MKEIGGYIEMSFDNRQPFHKKAIELNTARNCFEYIILARQVKKVYIPHYTCEVMLEPIKKHNINYEYYYLNENLDPTIPDSFQADDFLLYTNYFGIKQSTVESLSCKFNHLIIDNSMAFYAKPLENIDTFYSARKFFGVSDGAYLYSNMIMDEKIEIDYSYNRMLHLFKRIELGANNAYPIFLENDLSLYNQPIRQMSKITRHIMSSINYSDIKNIRERNFLFLHSFLDEFNDLQIDISNLNGPMLYPFLNTLNLKTKLITNKIYVPTLWRNALESAKNGTFEHDLTNNLLALPIDQRYTLEDMQFILKIIGLS